MNSSRLTAIIVDDEAMALDAMERMLNNHCSNIKIIGKTQNPEEAVLLIDLAKPNILFLDISMPRMDGFTLLDTVAYKKSQVIFTTAYDEYALQAFKASAVDYLLKPIDVNELKKAVNKVITQLQNNSTQNYIEQLFKRLQMSTKNLSTIALPTMEGLDFIKIKEIMYCHSDGNYSEIFLADGKKFLVTRKIKFMEEKLDKSLFVRVHNSYLVNLNYVKKYIKGRGGTLIMANGHNVPVSVRKKNDFLDAF